jgi:guanosine-3',5'-bis(diphosphate) 3'-pyrophosphohydrolase
MTMITYSNEQIMAMVQPLFDTMQKRVTPEEMAMIHKAFNLAREAHSQQKRSTGEPYIIHPIAVARIVGEDLCLGANPVCAAFLHDVVEDTPYTIEDIEEQFGSDVAFLVRVVTKTIKDSYETSKQVDNFRQMLDSVKYDIRALLIKLSDRLHNMRTLSSMPPAKQMKIAGETDYFYAPLANRLGLYRVKIELENLSFRYRCPREYENLKELLAKDEEENRSRLEHFIEQVGARLKDNGIDAHIEVDYRRPFSIRRKMQISGQDFNHIENKQFVRIVFGSKEGASEKMTALKIYELLTDVFKDKPGSMINYIDSPKDNGYQSLHVKLLAANGKWEEVHISSERMRRVSRLGCIADREESNIYRWIERLKSTLQDIANHNHEIGFMEGVVTSFYNDDIMVFTPHGDAITLPKNSTVLDFAFEVHTELGLHAQYARINGKLQSVKTELNRGDCIEIGKNKEVWPKADWLKYVRTYKAKRNIKSYLLKQPKPKMVRCEHCHPLPGDEVIGFNMPDKTIEVHKRDCQAAISKASQDGDSVVAVTFAPMDNVLFPVSIHVRAVDRFHLLTELIECITNELKLSIKSLKTDTVDEIVDCDIDFSVHSFDELQTVITSLEAIKSVDEVWHNEE